MGRGRALEALLGADDFSADLAERYGWINRAVPDAELAVFVETLARRISRFRSPASPIPNGRSTTSPCPHRMRWPKTAGCSWKEWVARLGRLG